MSDITDIDNDLPTLETDILDLKEQLKGVINADMSSESASKLVPFISEEEELDALVTLDSLETRSRWASSAVNKSIEIETAGNMGCCVVC
mmetsp:Transcript_1552/g.1683  ORF Transcript_1552/g.1683 Transcript_1552/m.1683 type:complete len:90 (-) Transcript_1552:88-357(-)|eukprot:CAMPEP_0198251334 /NCGR_PEP_ID=MMETSP1447-20131203/2197_1 /TAXON_ID=420782 /ORGANISM="Chaetoceros dichaeta, Strain CCMP1751" /LENGTH=89 /DNA_ID=CAMNT_0043936321 /DNA_START=157 /DNA_END=426 /DNA_ORIENTATION=-